MNRTSNAWSDPLFFKVLDYMELQKSMIGRYLVALQFEQQELADPEGDLVGIAFWAGCRRYLWADRWWAEYPLEVKLELERLAGRLRTATDEEFKILLKVLDWVYKYKDSRPPDSEYLPKFPSSFTDLCNGLLSNIRPKPITRMLYPLEE